MNPVRLTLLCGDVPDDDEIIVEYFESYDVGPKVTRVRTLAMGADVLGNEPAKRLRAIAAQLVDRVERHIVTEGAETVIDNSDPDPEDLLT